MAQLSSDFHYFSCVPATADIVIDVDGLYNILPSWSSSTSTSMRMIFSTNQRPRNHLTHTHRNTQRQRIDILAGPALRVTPAKMEIENNNDKMQLLVDRLTVTNCKLQSCRSCQYMWREYQHIRKNLNDVDTNTNLCLTQNKPGTPRKKETGKNQLPGSLSPLLYELNNKYRPRHLIVDLI